jgi:hypothetical protein
MAYLGYGKRAARQTIDWGELSKSVSTGLESERDERKKIKSEIDEATQALGTTISQSPQGQKVSLNEFATSASSQFSKARLALDRKLKSGEMPLSDYKLRRQNLRDGVDYLYKTVDSRQKSYQESMERVNNGTASSREIWEMEQAEGFTDFSETGLFIDPNSYKSYLGKYNKDSDGNIMPGMSSNPNDHEEVSVLAGKYGVKYNAYDVEKELKSGVDKLGKQVDFMSKNGTYGSFSDITKRDEYTEAENLYIKKMMANPDNAGHILLDYVGENPETGEKYTYTRDPEEAKKDPNKVLIAPDPDNRSSGRMVVSPSSGQEEVIKEALKNRMRVMIDREYKISGRYPAKSTPSSTEMKYQRGVGSKASMLTNLAQAYYGTNDQITSAIQAVVGMSDGGIRNVKRTPDGIIAEKWNTKEKVFKKITIDFKGKDGKVKSQEDFLRGAGSLLFDDIEDLDAVLGQTKFDPNKEFNPDSNTEFGEKEQFPSFDELEFKVGDMKIDIRTWAGREIDTGTLLFDTDTDRASAVSKKFDGQIRSIMPKGLIDGVKVRNNGNILVFEAPGVKKSINITKANFKDKTEIINTFEAFYNEVINSKSAGGSAGSGEENRVDPNNPLAI